MKSKKRSGRKYPRGKTWIERRDEAFARANHTCEVTGASLAGKLKGFVNDQPITSWARACDHIFPERFVRRFFIGADPHVLENLIVITPALHARKTAVEWRIFRGDTVGYFVALRVLGFDQVLIDRALMALAKSSAARGVARLTK